jgi:hypothetical protein
MDDGRAPGLFAGRERFVLDGETIGRERAYGRTGTAAHGRGAFPENNPNASGDTMGVETQSFRNSSADLEQVGRSIADFLTRDRGFTPTLQARTDDGVVLKMEKRDFGRQLTGLVYTVDVSLRRHGDTVTVTVDDGDLRNQVLALGVGVLLPMLWPLLLTAGYGWVTKGDIRGQVIARAAQALQATM